MIILAILCGLAAIALLVSAALDCIRRGVDAGESRDDSARDHSCPPCELEKSGPPCPPGHFHNHGSE